MSELSERIRQLFFSQTDTCEEGECGHCQEFHDMVARVHCIDVEYASLQDAVKNLDMLYRRKIYFLSKGISVTQQIEDGIAKYRAKAGFDETEILRENS